MSWCERNARETIAGALSLFVIVAILAHCVGCKATCAVIDLASKTCPAVVEYVDQYGVRRTVDLTNDDARGLAARKAAARDAGAE